VYFTHHKDLAWMIEIFFLFKYILSASKPSWLHVSFFYLGGMIQYIGCPHISYYGNNLFCPILSKVVILTLLQRLMLTHS
jgi:hypothetical protein